MLRRIFLFPWCCLMLVGVGFADRVAADHAEIEDTRTLLIEGVYRVGARVLFDMDEKVLAALDSGVPLVVLVEIRVIRRYSFIWSTTESQLSQRYRIQFHALSERYTVEDLNKGTLQSFLYVSDLLDTIGTVYDVPVIRDSDVQGRKQYFVRMRVSFDIESLPTPIRLWAYFGSDWKLTGGWYEWPLNP
ncbi:MAG: DUF4390 domain-containing protein [Gammaproteobacteria bacterium]